MSSSTTSPRTQSTPRPPDQLTNLKTLGAIMRCRRLRLGMTLDELAQRTRISKPFLSLVENERARARDAKLMVIESALMFHGRELVKLAALSKTPRAWHRFITAHVDFEYAKK